MSANPGLQISLDVKGRSCLVLGGDDEAAEKVQRLLEAGHSKQSLIHFRAMLNLRSKMVYRGISPTIRC